MIKEIVDIYEKLLIEGQNSENTKWQAITIDSVNNPLFGINNSFIEFPEFTNLAEELMPDLPWAEDHFLERINGKPINPGIEYKNWPYYKKSDNDELFRSGGKFSHNYMERYWPRKAGDFEESYMVSDNRGIRYEMGDLNDVIERINENNYTRQAFLAVWHPEDQSNNGVRVPCTIGYWFNMENGKLTMTYLLRSCDAIRHFRNDVYMSYRLLQHVCEKTGLTPGKLKMWIGNFHCFKSDIYTLTKIVKNNK